MTVLPFFRSSVLRFFGSSVLPFFRSFVWISLIGSLLTVSNGHSSAIMATARGGNVNDSGGNQILIFPAPGTNLPTPTINTVSGLPEGAKPHGVGFFGTDSALVGDSSDRLVYVIQVSTNSLLSTINTVQNGHGSIAISPLLTHALTMGNSILSVIHAPFTATSVVSTIQLPGSIGSYQTEAIVFNSAGRAFVYHTNGISILEPPYTAVTLTIPVTNNGSSGSIAITPDGNTLLVTTRSGSNVQIFNAPFLATSIPTTLAVGGVDLDGIVVAPNGETALVVDTHASNVFAIHAPFNAASMVESIPLPVGIGNFEDIDIDATSNLAIATGYGVSDPEAPVLFIQAPFTAEGATTFAVAVPGGRGAGAVRFLPAALSATASLSITKTGPLTVDPNGQITYTLTYGNTGQADAVNTVIQDTLPANTSFVSASHNGTLNGNAVVWNMGTIGMGVDNQTVQFTVQTNAAPGSNITNDAYSVTADGLAVVAGSEPVITMVNQVQAVQPVPTLNQWMILLCMILLFGIAALRLRQA